MKIRKKNRPKWLGTVPSICKEAAHEQSLKHKVQENNAIFLFSPSNLIETSGTVAIVGILLNLRNKLKKTEILLNIIHF